MDVEIGATKAQAWRSANRLPTRPDSITGSTETLMIEYGCPHSWQRITDAELQAFKLRVEGEATEQDRMLMQGLRALDYEAIDEDNQPLLVKQEPLTEKEVMEKSFADFQAPHFSICLKIPFACLLCFCAGEACKF